MGMTFAIDSLEDMCSLMCDNRIPTKGATMKNGEPTCCGECIYYLRNGDDAPPVGTCQPTREMIPMAYAWDMRGRKCPYKEKNNA